MVHISVVSTTNVSARTKARKRALDVLFEADQRSVSAQEVLTRIAADASVPLNPWVATLVEGVTAHAVTIDETIETYSEGWALDRMPAVDRALARIAVYELVYESEVPDAVTIDEIVSLASEISTDESPAFLNGLLGRIAAIKHRISLD
ncbi:MAG: transcription antitermination factor NusB [Actinomycetota bacterium]|jgi:N utilization substance protein B